MGRTLCAATGFMLTFGGESRAKKTLYYLHFFKGGGFGTSENFSLKKEEKISYIATNMGYILGGMRDIQKDLVFCTHCGLVLVVVDTVLRNDKAVLTPLSNALLGD